MTELKNIINTVWDADWYKCLEIEEDQILVKDFVKKYPAKKSILLKKHVERTIVVPIRLFRFVTIFHWNTYMVIKNLLEEKCIVHVLWDDLIIEDASFQQGTENQRRFRHENLLRELCRENLENIHFHSQSDVYKKEVLIEKIKHKNNLLGSLQGVENPDWSTAQLNSVGIENDIAGLINAVELLNHELSEVTGYGAVLIGLDRVSELSKLIQAYNLDANSNLCWGYSDSENNKRISIIPTPRNNNIKTWNLPFDYGENRSYYLDTILDLRSDEENGINQLENREGKDLLYHAKCVGVNVQKHNPENVKKNNILNQMFDLISPFERFVSITTTPNDDLCQALKNLDGKIGLNLLIIILENFKIDSYYSVKQIMKIISRLSYEGESVGRLIVKSILFEYLENLTIAGFLKHEHIDDEVFYRLNNINFKIDL